MTNPSLLSTHLASLSRALTSAATAARSQTPGATIKWKWRQSPPRQAAVLLPLVAMPIRPTELHVLFTVRSSRLRAHRGEVSFPGGMMDPTDPSHYDAARREVREELGIALPPSPKQDRLKVEGTTWAAGDMVGLLGDLTPLPDKSLTISVHPYVSYLGTLDLERELKVNPHEVAAVFTLPLAYLVNQENIKTTKPNAKRKLSLGRAVYWRVPDDTIVYVAPELESGEKGVKAVSKREFLHKYHSESAVDDVGHVSGGAGAQESGSTTATADDMDHMDVWGLTAFITKEFVSILQKEGVDKMLLNSSSALHPTPSLSSSGHPPSIPSPTSTSFSTAAP